jgi:hypothetical protein
VTLRTRGPWQVLILLLIGITVSDSLLDAFERIFPSKKAAQKATAAKAKAVEPTAPLPKPATPAAPAPKPQNAPVNGGNLLDQPMGGFNIGAVTAPTLPSLARPTLTEAMNRGLDPYKRLELIISPNPRLEEGGTFSLLSEANIQGPFFKVRPLSIFCFI